MSAVERPGEAPRPAARRPWGPAAGVLVGGAVVVAGSLLPWATAAADREIVVRGWESATGAATMALGGALVALGLARLGRGTGPAIRVVVAVVGLAAAAVAAAELATVERQAEIGVGREIRQRTGRPPTLAEVGRSRRALERAGGVRPGRGVYLALTGGLLSAVASLFPGRPRRTEAGGTPVEEVWSSTGIPSRRSPPAFPPRPDVDGALRGPPIQEGPGARGETEPATEAPPPRRDGGTDPL